MNKTETLRILKHDDALTPEASFPCTKTEASKQTENFLNKTEQLSLAKIVKADSPFVATVVRDEEPVEEPIVTKIIKVSPSNLNAAEQEGASEMVKAVKLVNAATYSISDLKRAQQTDIVTLALKRCLEHGTLEGTPWKCKDKEDKADLLDPEVRKIINDFYKQWRGELYVNPQGILCCRRKPEEKMYDHDAIVLPQLYQAEVMFRAHDDQGHQGMDKVIARIKQRFIWPGLNSAVKKWITTCRLCQNTKNPRGPRDSR